MADWQIVIITFGIVGYVLFGVLCAAVDIANREVYSPKDFYDNEGYNWFGSWFVFILKSITAFPFYIIGTLGLVIYRFIKWLFTVGRKDD